MKGVPRAKILRQNIGIFIAWLIGRAKSQSEFAELGGSIIRRPHHQVGPGQATIFTVHRGVGRSKYKKSPTKVRKNALAGSVR